MSKALDSQRTYALIGTGGCGKTSLAEMLLFQSGVINRLGAIEEGTTTLDYEPEEIKRRGSIQPGFATFLWNKDRHFLMDVPGDTNFSGDLPYLLMGGDAAVLVIDAVDGVRPLTRRIWNAVREAGLPSFVFINKMDRDRADFDMAFNGLSSVLGMKPVTLYMPVMTDGVVTGGVDILGGKARMFGENGAGKSTLLSLVCADNPQSYACDIELFGRKRGSGESIWDIKRHIGYVSPEMHRAYLKDLPAIDIVASGLNDSVGLYVHPRPEQRAVCEWWMDIFGIAGLKDRTFLKLSSGEQRLCLLARAFVKDPELLILDEPLHGLDDRNRQLTREIISAFCRRKDKIMIMVTHYAEELPDVITHNLFLKKNK